MLKIGSALQGQRREEHGFLYCENAAIVEVAKIATAPTPKAVLLAKPNIEKTLFLFLSVAFCCKQRADRC